jgi:hypothetical protein
MNNAGYVFGGVVVLGVVAVAYFLMKNSAATNPIAAVFGSSSTGGPKNYISVGGSSANTDYSASYSSASQGGGSGGSGSGLTQALSAISSL